MLLLNQQVHVPVSVNFRIVEMQLVFVRFFGFFWHMGALKLNMVKLF